MPPRHAYWTILIDGQPTAFRSAESDELLPTLNRLKAKHPDTVMKWFERGRLWESRDEARQALGQGYQVWSGGKLVPPRHPRKDDGERSRGEGPPETRDRGWRPGGEHRDPREKYALAKKAKWQRFKDKIRGSRDTRAGKPSGTPVAGGRGPADRSDRSRDKRFRDDRAREHPFRDDRPREKQSRDSRPRDDRPRDSRPREERPQGPRFPDMRAWDQRPRDSRSRDARPRDGRFREDRPRDGGSSEKGPKDWPPFDSRPPFDDRGAGGRKPRRDRPDDRRPLGGSRGKPPGPPGAQSSDRQRPPSPLGRPKGPRGSRKPPKSRGRR